MRPGNLAAPRTDEPCQRDDLAGVNVEGDVGEDALPGQALDLEHRLAALGLLFREERVHVAADHRADDRPGGEFVNRLRPDVPAVAHDGHALAEVENLLEAVRHEQHRRALVPERARDAEQSLDLGDGQGRSRLVHDDHARV